ncbi:MAG: GxxExxY protein [Deltaproteobacteria bacterium]|nr:GxxExxY protein [Deltaproteobacteria bacterium]MBW2193385.1 GxxExxY protein [Deltaproteobacteria bacterium]
MIVTNCAGKIVDAAYAAHKILGPGLLEKVYEVCFCHELSKRGLKYPKILVPWCLCG